MATSVLSNLTPQEAAQVQSKQRSQDELPEYFSSELNKRVKISREFEAYLILAPSDLKSSALEWIKNAVKINKSNKLRDDLSKILVDQELSNAKLKLDEYDSQLKNFQNFRQNFQTNTEFAAVPEVQLFITGLQSVMDEISLNRDRAFFDQTVGLVMQRFGDRTSVSNAEVEELQSWSAVISPYLSG